MTAAPELLQNFLNCPEGSQADSLLERLLADYAAPVIGRIVSSKIRRPASEDVQHDVLVDLIEHLQNMKSSGTWTAISDFAGYTAMAAYHGCREYYRQSFPERYRLGKRLRYLLFQASAIRGLENNGWGSVPQNRGKRSIPVSGRRLLLWPAAREMAQKVEAILGECEEAVPLEYLLDRLGVCRQREVNESRATVEALGRPTRMDRRALDRNRPAASTAADFVIAEHAR